MCGAQRQIGTRKKDEEHRMLINILLTEEIG